MRGPIPTFIGDILVDPGIAPYIKKVGVLVDFEHHNSLVKEEDDTEETAECEAQQYKLFNRPPHKASTYVAQATTYDEWLSISIGDED